jgi:hypothetical protein
MATGGASSAPADVPLHATLPPSSSTNIRRAGVSIKFSPITPLLWNSASIALSKYVLAIKLTRVLREIFRDIAILGMNLIDAQRKSRILRHLGEAVALAGVVIVFWTLDTLAKRNVRLVDGVGLDDFRLIAEQVTSGLTVWLLIPAVAWWLSRFPISSGQIGSKIVGHLLGSVLFASAHYFIMSTMRAVSYPWFGRTWQHSEFWLNNLLVEYQKDIKIYVAIIAIVGTYRRLRQDKEHTGERLPVQTGSGERLLEFAEIDCLEASRNYVSVFTAEKEYLLRETLASLESRLSNRGFLRTHRSFLVNRERVAGIEPASGGGQNIILKSGRKVPLSRSRRSEIRAALGLDSA